MSNKEKTLTMMGINCKGINKRNVFCTYLTIEEQKKFVEYWKEEIVPLLDKKIDELKEKRSKNEK